MVADGERHADPSTAETSCYRHNRQGQLKKKVKAVDMVKFKKTCPMMPNQVSECVSRPNQEYGAKMTENEVGRKSMKLNSTKNTEFTITEKESNSSEEAKGFTTVGIVSRKKKVGDDPTKNLSQPSLKRGALKTTSKTKYRPQDLAIDNLAQGVDRPVIDTEFTPLRTSNKERLSNQISARKQHSSPTRDKERPKSAWRHRSTSQSPTQKEKDIQNKSRSLLNPSIPSRSGRRTKSPHKSLGSSTKRSRKSLSPIRSIKTWIESRACNAKNDLDDRHLTKNKQTIIHQCEVGPDAVGIEKAFSKFPNMYQKSDLVGQQRDLTGNCSNSPNKDLHWAKGQKSFAFIGSNTQKLGDQKSPACTQSQEVRSKPQAVLSLKQCAFARPIEESKKSRLQLKPMATTIKPGKKGRGRSTSPKTAPRKCRATKTTSEASAKIMICKDTLSEKKTTSPKT